MCLWDALGEATVPHCPHSTGRMKRIIGLIAVTVAPWIAAGISVQTPGMQEAPAPFPVAAVSWCVALWWFYVAGDLERRKTL